MNENLLYDIVYDSDHVSEVMMNLLTGMPELFRITNFKGVKHLVVTAICNPETPVVTSSYSDKFYKILGKGREKSDTYKKTKSEQQRLADQLRVKIQRVVKGDFKDTDFLELLGCSGEEFQTHLSGMFVEGMTLVNYGIYTWHVDHINPLCSFDLTDLEQVKQATHYANLRPLSAKENLEKGKLDRKKSIRT